MNTESDELEKPAVKEELANDFEFAESDHQAGSEMKQQKRMRKRKILS